MKAKPKKLDALDAAYIDVMAHRATVNDVPSPFKGKPSRTKSVDDIPPIGDQQEYITREQCRLILPVSLMTIARLCQSGKLHGMQLNKMTTSTTHKSTSKLLYKKTEVLAYAEKRKREAALSKRRKVAV